MPECLRGILTTLSRKQVLKRSHFHFDGNITNNESVYDSVAGHWWIEVDTPGMSGMYSSYRYISGNSSVQQSSPHKHYHYGWDNYAYELGFMLCGGADVSWAQRTIQVGLFNEYGGTNTANFVEGRAPHTGSLTDWAVSSRRK